MRKKTPDLPPEVEAHVRKQLIKADWEKLLAELRTLCVGCPAEKSPEICINCPLEGISLDAGTIALKAHIAKLQARRR